MTCARAVVKILRPTTRRPPADTVPRDLPAVLHTLRGGALFAVTVIVLCARRPALNSPSGTNQMSEGSNRHDDVPDSGRTADSVEGWLRGLGQRGSGHEAEDRPRRVSGASRRGFSADDEASTFLRALQKLAESPKAQRVLASRLASIADDGKVDPAMRALAQALGAIEEDFWNILASQGGGGGATGVLDRPNLVDAHEPVLSDGGNGGGGDDDADDGDDGDDDGEDDEPWPTAFVGYRTGVVDRVDVGNCRDGCCTALFIDHPGVRAAVWFPTDQAAEFVAKIGEFLDRARGETAELSVQPFGEGAAPGRGQMQSAIQFFTDDIHWDAAEHESDRAQGAVARFRAYDQGLGHGGPALVDILVDASQARAVRKGLRRAARNAPRDQVDRHDHF